jgi:hypothetical protein
MMASYFAAIVAGLLIAGIDAGAIIAMIGLIPVLFGLLVTLDD